MEKKIFIALIVLSLILITVKAKADNIKVSINPNQVFPKTLGFSLNNPTNINAQNGGVYKGQIGEKETKDGLKRVFKSIEYGCLAASERIKSNYFSKGLNTIEKIAPVWTGGHSSEAWIKSVCFLTGKGRNDVLKIDALSMKILVRGMIFAENSVAIDFYYLRLI